MADSTTTVSNIGVGPLPNGDPGVTLVLSFSDGTSVPIFLLPNQARELAMQINNTINPRFPSVNGLELLQR